MNNTKQKLYLALGAIIFSLGFTSGDAKAQSCMVPPTCAELGYDKTAADCTYLRSIRCPFDTTKYSCADKLKVNTAFMGNYGYVVSDVQKYSPNKGIISVVLAPVSGTLHGPAADKCASTSLLGLRWTLPSNPVTEVCSVSSNLGISVGSYNADRAFWTASSSLVTYCASTTEAKTQPLTTSNPKRVICVAEVELQ